MRPRRAKEASALGNGFRGREAVEMPRNEETQERSDNDNPRSNVERRTRGRVGRLPLGWPHAVECRLSSVAAVSLPLKANL